MKKKRTISIICVFLMLASLLSGCASGSGEPSPQSREEKTQAKSSHAVPSSQQITVSVFPVNTQMQEYTQLQLSSQEPVLEIPDFPGIPEETEPETEPEETEPPQIKPQETEPKKNKPKQNKPKPTQPPATQPPVTQPPVTEPPATQPPVTEPPATQPPVTEPPATQPPATEPPATQPPATQPPATQPPATQPPATQPPATQPPATQPPASQPPAAGASQQMSSILGTESTEFFAFRQQVSVLGSAPVCRIQVQQHSPEGCMIYTGVANAEGKMVWDLGAMPPEDILEPLNDALLHAEVWKSCQETETYAVDARLVKSFVSDRTVFYSDEAGTVLQLQSYDAEGRLCSVAVLSQEGMELLQPGGLAPIAWSSEQYLELNISAEIPEAETPAPAWPDTEAYDEEIATLRQNVAQKQRMIIGLSITVVILLAAVAVLLLKNMRKTKRRVDTQQKETTKTPPAVTNASVKSVGVVHNVGSRNGQQDSYGVVNCPVGTLAVVADGMGGLADGDKVSRLIVETMRADASRIHPGRTEGVLPRMVAHANQEVNRMLGAARQYKSGSTLLAVLMEKNSMQWITVGDSRIYLYRGGEILQLNREHVYKADLLLRAINGRIGFGEAMQDPQAERLTSFVGMGELKYVDLCLSRVGLREGDGILLMSDGVFNTLSNREIAGILRNTADASEAATQMEQLVLQKQAPHQDNFTCVILRT